MELNIIRIVELINVIKSITLKYTSTIHILSEKLIFDNLKICYIYRVKDIKYFQSELEY